MTFAADLMVLEELEDEGEFVGIIAALGLVGENEEAFGASDEWFIEFDRGCLAFLIPEFLLFLVEAAEILGAEVEAGGFLMLVEHG